MVSLSHWLFWLKNKVKSVQNKAVIAVVVEAASVLRMIIAD